MKKIFLLLSLLVTSSAFAAGPFPGGRDWSAHPSLHKAGRGSVFPGKTVATTTVPTSTGTSLATQGTQRVAGTDVPIKVQSDYTRGAITAAAIAAAALCGSNPLTAIICGAAIQYGLDKGIKKCEESGWCKTDPSASPFDGYEYSNAYFPNVYHGSPSAACGDAAAHMEAIGKPSNAASVDFAVGEVTTSSCTLIRTGTLLDGSSYGPSTYQVSLYRRSSGTCDIGQWQTPTGCQNMPPLVQSPPPWADPGFPPYLEDRQKNDPYFGPEIGSEATSAGHEPASSPSGGPTVTAPPATGAPKTSTSTSTRPDGSTDTTTTTTTTTVTPTVTNNNTSNPTVTYNTSNNTSTSVTNNVTNQTTVTNTTTNSPGEQPELELPDDYNKEVTQQQIRDELEGKNAPAIPADQAARTTTEIAKTDTSLKDLFDGLPGKFTADKENWFSWVWTPPGGTCNASDYSGTVHGYAVTWDICPTVSKIREVLGFLFAIFGAYIVYGQIFKGSK